MALQRLGAVLLGSSFHGIEVGIERSFGIHDNSSVSREVNHQIRPHGALFAFQVGLHGEIAVCRHTSDLDQSLQGHFAPSPAALRASKGGHQIPRFVLELLKFPQQALIGLPAPSFQPLNLALQLAQGLLQRLDQALGAFQELRAVFPESFGG